MSFFSNLFQPRRAQPPAAPRKPDLAAAPAVRAPDWQKVHQGHWNLFLQSETGITLMARLKAVAHNVTQSACKDTFHTAHSAGTANGWNEAIQWLESLSRSSRVIEDPTTGAAFEPESQTYTPAPGEELLRDRMSP